MKFFSRRKSFRVDNIKAQFKYDGHIYDVIDISAEGLSVYCQKGIAPEIVTKFTDSKENIPFKLVDLKTSNEVSFSGRAVRTEVDEKTDQIVKMGIVFEAPNLNYLPEVKERAPIRTIAFGGSKGGIGKTLLSVNLATALSKQGQKVVLFDADFGNANCHTLLGITNPAKTLDDYLISNLSLEDIIIPTPYEGLSLICGSANKIDDLLSVRRKKDRLFKEIKKLSFDFAIIDLGAGISSEVLDFYNMSDIKIVVAVPQLTSLQNAYSFIKASLFSTIGKNQISLNSSIGLPMDDETKLKYHAAIDKQRFAIWGNMIENQKDLLMIDKIKEIIKRYLDIDSEIWESFNYCDKIKSSINLTKPFVVLHPDNENGQKLQNLANKIKL